MPTILKIGYNHFLVRKESDAAAVVKAMAGAVRLHADYSTEHKDRYWPDTDHNNEVGILNVPASKILRCEPGTDVGEVQKPAPKQITGALRLLP